MRSIRLLALALVAMGLATMGIAEPPPPVPEGGLTHYGQEACTDPVWGLAGTCFYSHDNKNNRYRAFYTEGDLCMYIEQEIDGKYVEIWRRSPDT